MDSVYFIWTIIGLLVVIVLQWIERSTLLDRESKEKNRLLEELSAANKALIAKNSNEYLAMRAMDKTIKEESRFQPELDEEEISELDDEEFAKVIKKQTVLAK